MKTLSQIEYEDSVEALEQEKAQLMDVWAIEDGRAERAVALAQPWYLEGYAKAHIADGELTERMSVPNLEAYGAASFDKENAESVCSQRIRDYNFDANLYTVPAIKNCKRCGIIPLFEECRTHHPGPNLFRVSCYCGLGNSVASTTPSHAIEFWNSCN